MPEAEQVDKVIQAMAGCRKKSPEICGECAYREMEGCMDELMLDAAILIMQAVRKKALDGQPQVMETVQMLVRCAIGGTPEVCRGCSCIGVELCVTGLLKEARRLLVAAYGEQVCGAT